MFDYARVLFDGVIYIYSFVDLINPCFVLSDKPLTTLLFLSADLIVILLKLESELSIDNFKFFLYVRIVLPAPEILLPLFTKKLL